jgi:penicillin-binding protein 2
MRNKKNVIPTRIKRRAAWMFTIILAIFIGLLGKLTYIQVIEDEFYRKKAYDQSEVQVQLSSNRGIIYDRNNKPLTDTKKETIMIIRKIRFKLNEEEITMLKSITKMEDEEILAAFQDSKHVIELPVNYMNSTYEDILKEKDVLIKEKTYRYSDENLLTHIIGYINKDENKGVSGIEKSKDDFLKNKNTEYVQAFIGRTIGLVQGSVKTEKSNDDKNLKLTIDYDIQKIVEKALDSQDKPSAVVISDVDSGELLSISSRPNFDPDEIEKYVKSKDGELVNRAVQATYPPGSVFKIVVAYAALEYKVVDDKEIFNCTGEIDAGGHIIRCPKIGGHGSQTFEQAFANSCNTTFVEVAQRLGTQKILLAAKKLHLEEKIGIGLDDEVSKKLPEDIDIGNLSIGQGELEFTPLQINQLTQIVANNGLYRPLYLYDSILDKNMNEIKNLKSSKDKDIISPYTIGSIKNMMKLVNSIGTGDDLKDLKGESGGKTGSAESYGDGKKLTHGWFTGFYPANKPKYVITVFVYDGKSGAGSAVPIFKQICEDINKI